MKKTLKKILKSYIKTTGKKKFIFSLFFGVFIAFISVIEPWIFTKIIKIIEEFFKTKIFDYSSFVKLIIFWVVFILFSIIITYIYRYYFVQVSCNKNYKNTISKYSKKIINMSYGDYLGRKTGSIYKTLSKGVDDQYFLNSFIFNDILRNISGIIIIIAILFYVNVTMALITLSMLPVMIGFGLYFFYKLAPIQKKLTNRWIKIFGTIGDIMSNFYLSKTLNLEKPFKKQINKDLDKCLKDQLIVEKGWGISDIYIASLVMISRILVLGFGTYFLINGSLSFTELFLFFSYIGWIYFPLGMIFARLYSVQIWLTSVEKMHSEFDSLEKDNSKSGIKLKDIKGDIEYRNVDFAYNKKSKVLDNLSFNIKAGKQIALVGNTGEGKSTIINLLLRFWDIKHGEILIDGKKINKINKTSLRDHIGVVSQDNSLFNLSILENLSFANPTATLKEIKTAIKNAEASFVFDLENGLDTVIGERGLKLSGGEKQRLSIARLFLKNPRILVLDEATSALDNKTERLVQKALNKLIKGRTSIVIAHRLSTIQGADTIFMLEKGKIIEKGSYEELMNKKAKFYNLANPEHFILN